MYATQGHTTSLKLDGYVNKLTWGNCKTLTQVTNKVLEELRRNVELNISIPCVVYMSNAVLGITCVVEGEAISLGVLNCFKLLLITLQTHDYKAVVGREGSDTEGTFKGKGIM